LELRSMVLDWGNPGYGGPSPAGGVPVCYSLLYIIALAGGKERVLSKQKWNRQP